MNDIQMYAATLNILQQFLGLWVEVIPQKLFVCNNVYNKHQFPITSHFINCGWFHQRSKISPSAHPVCFNATQHGTQVWRKQHEWPISVFDCHS